MTAMSAANALSRNMIELYRLACWITADRDFGEQAFTEALDATEGGPVFQEFMQTWARHLVMVAALGAIRPQLQESIERVERAAANDPINIPPFKPPDPLNEERVERVVLELDTFPRCAILLTVFEGISTDDTARLLNTTEDLVNEAKVRGLIEMTSRLGSGRDVRLEPVLSFPR